MQCAYECTVSRVTAVHKHVTRIMRLRSTVRYTTWSPMWWNEFFYTSDMFRHVFPYVFILCFVINAPSHATVTVRVQERPLLSPHSLQNPTGFSTLAFGNCDTFSTKYFFHSKGKIFSNFILFYIIFYLRKYSLHVTCELHFRPTKNWSGQLFPL